MSLYIMHVYWLHVSQPQHQPPLPVCAPTDMPNAAPVPTRTYGTGLYRRGTVPVPQGTGTRTTQVRVPVPLGTVPY